MVRPIGKADDRRLTIMVTSAGRRVELLNCFRTSAADLGLDLEIIACDAQPELSSACVGADRAFPVPFATDPDYSGAILHLCRREGVRLVVPTVDPELAPLSQAASALAAIGAQVAISGPETVTIARDKLLTARFLRAHGIDAPHTAPADRLIPPELRWPLLAKPRHGSSGRGVRVVADADALRRHIAEEAFVVQERLHGREHTVNMFVDGQGRLLAAVPHERLRVRAGEVEKGVTRRVPALEEMAERIAAALPGVRGPLCFQAMVDESGRPRVFEINARFGGGYPLCHAAGAPFARWLLEEAIGRVPAGGASWRAGLTMLRYDAAVFTNG